MNLLALEEFKGFESEIVKLMQRGLSSQSYFNPVTGVIDEQTLDNLRSAILPQRAQHATDDPTGWPDWFRLADRELGVSEFKGNEDNPRIIEYFTATTFQATDDETPWCSAFVNWCIASAGLIPTGSAAARSWLNWGRSCSKTPGSIVVLSRPGGESWQGHVGFLVSHNSSVVELLGGNQGNKVSLRSYPIDRVIDCRWPIEGGVS